MIADALSDCVVVSCIFIVLCGGGGGGGGGGGDLLQSACSLTSKSAATNAATRQDRKTVQHAMRVGGGAVTVLLVQRELGQIKEGKRRKKGKGESSLRACARFGETASSAVRSGLALTLTRP